MKYYIGIDLGGTNIVAGVVNESYEILAKASVKTNLPRPEEEIAADMAKVSQEAAEKAGLTMADIEWIGVGTPGVANSATGVIEYSNNLGFNNTPMVKYLETALGKPTFIENDANAAAYGEYVAGAAKGAKNAVCITLGTGVGAGIVIDGKIYSGSNFGGAEVGHTVISVVHLRQKGLLRGILLCNRSGSHDQGGTGGQSGKCHEGRGTYFRTDCVQLYACRRCYCKAGG